MFVSERIKPKEGVLRRGVLCAKQHHDGLLCFRPFICAGLRRNDSSIHDPVHLSPVGPDVPTSMAIHGARCHVKRLACERDSLTCCRSDRTIVNEALQQLPSLAHLVERRRD